MNDSSYSEHEHRHHHHHHHHHHSHDGGSGSGGSSSGRRRRGTSSGYDGEESRGHYHRRHGNSHPSARAKVASTVCIFCAVLAVAALVVGYVVASKEDGNTFPIFDIVAGGLAVLGFVFGFYAEIVQLRYWNPKVKLRLMGGMPLTLVVIAAVGYGWFQRYRKGLDVGTVSSDQPAAAEEKRDAETDDDSGWAQVDRSLFKPGWYGDVQQGMLMAVVVSYEANALESVQFNQRLEEPVVFASLSLLNTGQETVELQDLTPVLTLKDGTEVKARDARELLMAHKAANVDLLARLELPIRLTLGQMSPLIPICMADTFDWHQVERVTFTAGKETVTVPGRWYTAQERERMMDTKEPEVGKP